MATWLDHSQGTHPYRVPSSPPRASGRPRAVVVPSLAGRVLLVALLLVGVWIAVMAAHERRLTRVIHALPAPLQQEMYRRTYDELATVCSTQPGLDDHCRDEADLLLRFPQCDADCRALAQRVFRSGTK